MLHDRDVTTSVSGLRAGERRESPLASWRQPEPAVSSALLSGDVLSLSSPLQTMTTPHSQVCIKQGLFVFHIPGFVRISNVLLSLLGNIASSNWWWSQDTRLHLLPFSASKIQMEELQHFFSDHDRKQYIEFSSSCSTVAHPRAQSHNFLAIQL